MTFNVDSSECTLRNILAEISDGRASVEALKETPGRWLRALAEMTSGYKVSAGDILRRQFVTKAEGLVVVTGIDFVSVCEHHLLPFVGTAAVAYLPLPDADGNCKVVGLSKIPRLVDALSRRLQLQETLTTEIGTHLVRVLRTRGVAVRLRAQHGCMAHRGASKARARMVTQFLHGDFKSSDALRAEVLRAMGDDND